MFIRSERLFLRPCWPEDREEVFRLVSQDQIARTIPARCWPHSIEDVGTIMEHARDGRLPQFLITLPTAEGQTLVGTASLARYVNEVELFYCISPAHRGRGYATEAVRAVLMQARALGHSRVVSSYFAEHPAIGRVLEKAGFVPTGASFLRRRHTDGEAVPALEMAVSLQTVGDDGDPAMRAA
jgi:RimJ/RimL family protein N-acetyltransferase